MLAKPRIIKDLRDGTRFDVLGDMWKFAVILTALTAVGCSIHRAPTSQPSHQAIAPPCFENARVAALVFDPPVSVGDPPLDLSRTPRERSAFVSYDEVFSTYFYVRMDDRQILSNSGNSQRRVVTETFGVTRR